MTTDEFIIKAKQKHGNRYDYSNAKYVNSKTPINILCEKHGLFQQTATNHHAGQNCPICMGRGKGNNERFINNAKRVHGNRYDYSEVKYVKNHIRVKIVCREHGVFEQMPTRHTSGDGCPKCNGGVKSNCGEFIRRAIEKHGDKYDYSLVEYINSKTKVSVICGKHGIFKIVPSNHLIGQGCSICGLESKIYTTAKFIEKAKKIHGNIYDYSQVNYVHNAIKIKIICKEHGIFEQKPNCHLTGRGCSKCKIKSKGELFISDWLNQNEINHEVQKSFLDCKNTLPLRYDFYLPKYNILIEYDGEPHFREVKYLGGQRGFELRQINDKLKTEYALNNNIKLLRISYSERKNLQEILKNNITI